MGNEFNRAREQLRATHGVHLVQPQEEGTAAADLPERVYGFTGSPGLAAPLFAVRQYRNFEVHRCHGGVAIVGFVSAGEAARLAGDDRAADTRDAIDITLYPDAEGDATEIVAVAYSAIVQHRQYAIRNAAGLALRIRPSALLTQPTAHAREAAQPQSRPPVAT
jgi:hypothetical protein